MSCCHTTEAGPHSIPAPALHRMPVVDVSPYAFTTLSSSTTWIGEVIDGEAAGLPEAEYHILVQFSTKAAVTNRIRAEVAHGLNVSPGDRVLFVIPANSTLAVITSVLSSDTAVANCERVSNTTKKSNGSQPSQELVLSDSESLCVTTSSGQTLVAIERGATGPIVRLGQGSLQMDMPGELHLMADSLRFTTRSGPISIESLTDDVIVQGRTIRLN